MFLTKILIFNLFYFSYTSKITNNKDSKLLFIFEHYRHGARSPCSGLDENYIDLLGEKWNGDCELSEKGYLQHYLIGLEHREKYYNFLNFNKYNPNNIKVFSTNTNRTLTSIQTQLMGLFNTSYSNIVIPVHIYEENNNDNTIKPLFYYTKDKTCPNLEKYLEKNLKSEKLKNMTNYFNNNYNDIIKTIYNKTNIDFKKIEKFCSIYISDYVDDRNLEKIKHITFNKDELYNDCSDVIHLKHFERKIGENLDFYAIMVMSPYMRKIINYMDNIILYKNNDRINDENNITKYVIYSGHDTSLSLMQYTLYKIFDLKINKIPYASFMNFYLIEEENKNYFVHYYYNDKKMMEIEYAKFKKKIIDNIKPDYSIEDFCIDLNSSYNKTILILSSISIFLFIVLISLCCYFICSKKKGNYINLEKATKSIENLKNIV